MNKFKLFMGLASLTVLLLMTTNSYSQWTFCPGSAGLPTPGTANLPSISIVDANNAWVAYGNNGAAIVYKTTNGGANFVNAGTGLGLDVFCIWAVDANTAYVGDGGGAGGVGGNAKVFKTTNGGTSWTMILSTGGSAGFINSIVFSRINPNFGIIQSDPPSGLGGAYWVQRTTNGGATWTLQSPPGVSGQATAENGLAVVDDQFYGFGLGNNAPARFLLTTNGGTSWTTKTLSTIAGGFVSGLAFKTDKTVILGGTDMSLPTISRSSDGGNSFSNLSTGSGTSGLSCIKYIPGTSICYLSGNGTGTAIAKSTNDGLTWSAMTTGGITGVANIDLVYQGGVIYGYGAAADGSVIKLTETPTGILPINGTIPTSFALVQNYPNPFNPTTNIKYSVPKGANVTLKIYNDLGKEVMTVVNAYHSAGNYVQSVDMSNLASGIYFYTMTSGDFRDTKKMMLVK